MIYIPQAPNVMAVIETDPFYGFGDFEVSEDAQTYFDDLVFLSLFEMYDWWKAATW